MKLPPFFQIVASKKFTSNVRQVRRGIDMRRPSGFRRRPTRGEVRWSSCDDIDRSSPTRHSFSACHCPLKTKRLSLSKSYIGYENRISLKFLKKFKFDENWLYQLSKVDSENWILVTSTMYKQKHYLKS